MVGSVGEHLAVEGPLVRQHLLLVQRHLVLVHIKPPALAYTEA